MKNTWIVTMEVTEINGADRLDEKATVEMLKHQLDADDVVITKIQKFEGTDGNHE